MEFWPLFTVASVPVAEIMLVGTLGAFLASGYVNILSVSPSSKHFKNQIVPFLSRGKMRCSMSNTWGRFKEITGGTLHQIAEELLTPHAGTMAELFDVGQEECSVVFLWTYLTAALALTIWSTIFMWMLT